MSQAPSHYPRLAAADPASMQRYAFVRAPGDEIHRFELGFVEREPIDLGRARDQHAQFCETLRGLNIIVVELPPIPELPNSCIIRDAAVLLDDPVDPVVIPARTLLPSRRGEPDSILASVPEHFRVYELKQEEERFEGGDVVTWGGQTLVGWSPRTNHAAHRELQRIIRMRQLPSESLPVRRMNHLNSALAGLDEESVLISPLFLDTIRAEKYELIPVEAEEYFCANMLPVGGKHIVDDLGPRTRRMLEGLGHEIVPVDLSEFRKIEAGASDLALLFSSMHPPRHPDRSLAVE